MSGDGRVVITGTAGGIGRALAERFLAEGWAVAGVDVRAGSLAHDRYRHLEADVADEAAVEAAFDAAFAAGPFEAVIANAAVTDLDHHAVVELDFSLWRRVLSVNLDGAFLVGRAAARHMREQGRGNIVFVTSSLAFLGNAKANDAPYCASKAGVEMLARVLALELAGTGVNVNTVFPSAIIDTGFFAHLPPDSRPKLEPPDILNEAALFLARLGPGALSGHSLDHARWREDDGYRRSLEAPS